MRFRIYKRKVLILMLVVAACGFVLWSSSGRQRKNEALAPPLLDVDPARGAGARAGDHLAVSVGIRQGSNESAAPLVAAAPQPEVDNLTLRYRSLVYQLNFDQTLRNVDKAGSWTPPTPRAGAGGPGAQPARIPQTAAGLTSKSPGN